MLLTCSKNRGSELLPKRAVFNGERPQEAPLPNEKRVQALNEMDVSGLRQELTKTNTTVQEKRIIAESLIEKIEDSDLSENGKKDLRKEITDTLTALESTSLDIMDVIRLRFQLASVDSTPYAEAIKIVWPSKEARSKLFSNLSEKTAEFAMMAVGFFMKLKTKVTAMWENISNGRLPTTPPPQPNEPNRPNNPPQPERAPLNENIRNLDKYDINDNPENTANYIYFTVTPSPGVTAQYRVTLDGNTIETIPAGGTLSDQVRNNLALPKYLKDHTADVDNLCQKFNITTAQLSQRADLTKALFRAQRFENRPVNNNPQDIIQLLVQKWSQYEASELIVAGPQVVLAQILTARTDQQSPIIEAFKTLPAQPAGTPPPAPAATTTSPPGTQSGPQPAQPAPNPPQTPPAPTSPSEPAMA